MCFITSPIVKKLTNKLPDLLSKIESINQQLLPLGNISDNVDRIRELIQQARDAANKVGDQGSFFDKLPYSSGKQRLLFTQEPIVFLALILWLLEMWKLISSTHPWRVDNHLTCQGPETLSSSVSLCGQEEGFSCRPQLVKYYCEFNLRVLWSECANMILHRSCFLTVTQKLHLCWG